MSLASTSSPPRRKRIRLLRSDYLGRRLYFVTICCHRRRPMFHAPDRARWLIEKLRQTSLHHTFSVHAYCVMPDHFHFLLEGLTDTSNLISFMLAFKQSTEKSVAKTLHHPVWQRSFYDHILRGRDSAESVSWYIWLNPVRKDLCAQPWDYPFSGSFTLDTPDWKRSHQPLSWTPPWKQTL